MILLRPVFFMLLVSVIGLFPSVASPASAATLVDMDTILVRQSDHDLLLVRPWVEGSTPGYLLWGVPIDATVKIQPQIPIDTIRLYEWEGLKPLSKTNHEHLQTLCAKEVFAHRQPVPCEIHGPFMSIRDLQAGCKLVEISLSQQDRDQAEEYFRSHQKIILIQWSEDQPGLYGQTWDTDRIPLMAFTMERPTFWTELPVHWPGSRRGCLGSFIMIANHPLVPEPEEAEAWGMGLLTLNFKPELRKYLAGLAPGLSQDAPMVIAALHRCDDSVSLHPVPLDLSRDLGGSAGNVAATWAGHHPSTAHASQLRTFLADTSIAGDNTAFAIWAWGQQNTSDVAEVLAPWLRHSDGLCWSEAWEAMRVHDGAGFDLHFLATANTGAHQNPGQRSIDLSGWRVFQTATTKDSLVLRQIANQDGGWSEWATQAAHSHPSGHRYPHGLHSNQLSAGQWAVLTLARLGDRQATQCLTRALVSSAAVNLLDEIYSRKSSHHQTLRRWNIHLILKPHDLSRYWPTLYQFCLATACLPEFRDQFLSRVVDDRALPGEAVSVVLSRISHWSSQDMENAWSALLTYKVNANPLMTRDMMTILRWNLTSAGMAYAMASQFSDRQIKEFMEDCKDSLLQAELITSQARWGFEDIAATVEKMILQTWQPILVAGPDPQRPPLLQRPPYQSHDLMRYIPEHQARIIRYFLSTSNPGHEVLARLKSRTDLCPMLVAFLDDCREMPANPHTYPREGFQEITYPWWPPGK